jgi:predicted porin
MKKTLLAVAIAALPVVAMAQTNVSIYGVADVALVRATASGDQKASKVDSGGLAGSRLGFMGTEELGGGYSARFVMETNFSMDAGAANGITTTRQSLVALVTPWGAIAGGRIQNAGYAFSTKYDTMGASIFSPVAQLTDNAALVISGRDSNNRSSNAVAYTAVSGPISFGAGVSFGTSDAEPVLNTTHSLLGAPHVLEDAQLGVSARLFYDNGPLSIGGTYVMLNDIGGTAKDIYVGGVKVFDWVPFDRREWALGASYDMGLAKVTASYQQSKNTGNSNLPTSNSIMNTPIMGGYGLLASATGYTDKVFAVGASIKAGSNGKVNLAYANLKNNRTLSQKADSMAIDYEYALSKRTTAYVGYSMLDNKNANTTFTLLNTGVKPTADGRASQIAVGVSHSF